MWIATRTLGLSAACKNDAARTKILGRKKLKTKTAGRVKPGQRPKDRRTNETDFIEHGIAAGSELARENGDDGDLQGTGQGKGGAAQAESGWRPPGGPDRARGRAQSRLLLLAGALRLLEKRAPWAGTAD